MSDEARIMDLAQHSRDAVPVVHGIATARLSQSGEDAALLIRRYLEDAIGNGLTMPQAWTALFSSSMLVLGSALEVAASATNTTPGQVLAGMALEHQLAQS